MGRAGERHRVGGGADDERLAVYSSFFVHSRFILASFIHSRFILISFRLMMIFVIYVFFQFHQYSERRRASARYSTAAARRRRASPVRRRTAEPSGIQTHYPPISLP